jgi:small subunit ribosomal protein S18
MAYRRRNRYSKLESVDYKDVDTLRKFVNERGKIVSRRVSGLSAKQQRMVTRAVKRARNMALLPFTR